MPSAVWRFKTPTLWSLTQMFVTLGFVSLCWVLAQGQARAMTAPCEKGFAAGAAQDDITGPFAGVGMMGYAEPSQVAQGLHMRLRSRALVLQDRCPGGKTVALVTNDMGMIFYGLKKAVLASLQSQLPGVFDDDNLMLSATHTHAGPGGFAHHTLYNFTTLGFHPDVFEALKRGTVQAIVKAYKSAAPATLTVTRGELEGIQFNRSLDAYSRNPVTERDHYGRDHNPTMVLLKVQRPDGQPVAAFNWFAIHPVSLPLENRLISGDNKGLASYFFEKSMGTTYQKEGEFVAAFAQGSAGDISPYPLTEAEQRDKDGFERNRHVALAQAQKAMELFRTAGDPLNGPLTTAHQFVDLAHHQVSAAYTELENTQKTCAGSLGVGFAAGTENGQPLKIFREGTIYGVNWPRITLLPREQHCQAEKVVLLPTGMMVPWPWTARVAPFQMIRIGSLVIVATPYEITTMAGRRLEEQVLRSLADDGVKTVVINSIANEYMHYVTTREEFAQQAYEGGSNLFGPWSLAASMEIFTGLSHTLAGGPQSESAAKPLDLAKMQIVLTGTPAYDVAPPQAHFGDVVETPRDHYSSTDKAQATFWCAHPNRHAASRETYLTVERDTPTGWVVVRHDWDDDTFFSWQRATQGEQADRCTVRWQIPPAVESGTYRLCHQGTFLTQATRRSPYAGCTDGFIVN